MSIFRFYLYLIGFAAGIELNIIINPGWGICYLCVMILMEMCIQGDKK